MRWPTVLILWIVAVGMEPPSLLLAQPPQVTDTSTLAPFQAILDEQSQAWNRGDIDGFMEAYWKSPALSFSSGGGTTWSWQATRDRYRKRYATPETMGHLTFGKLRLVSLGENAALVLGDWKLSGLPDEPEGNFSLVFRRVKGHWRIVHDHTSLRLPPAQPETRKIESGPEAREPGPVH